MKRSAPDGKGRIWDKGHRGGGGGGTGGGGGGGGTGGGGGEATSAGSAGGGGLGKHHGTNGGGGTPGGGGGRRKSAGERGQKQWYEAAGDTAPDKASVVVLSDFVGARAPETMVMATRCSNLAADGAKAGQRRMMLLRRRAASHKPYKLPLSVRIDPKKKRRKLDEPVGVIVSASGGMHSSKVERCRANRRSRKALASRQGGGRWLETHLWHAKRFRMQDMWGYTLAESRRDAGERAACRWAAERCILHDASYTACFEIRGAIKALLSTVSSVMSPIPMASHSGEAQPSRLGPSSPACVRGGMVARGIIHGSSGTPIGPASILWMPVPNGPPVQRVVWIWVHPACSGDVFTILQEAAGKVGAEVGNVTSSLSRLELRGHEAMQLASRMLTPAPGSKGPAEDLWKELSLRQSACLPDGAVVVLTVLDPRLVTPAPQHPRSALAVPSWVESGGSAPAGRPAAEWSMGACAVADKWRHSPPAMSDAEIHRLRRHGPLRPSEGGQSMTPVMAIWRAGGQGEAGGCQGWDIILQHGWGGVFWKAAVLAGGRAVGLRESEVVVREWGGAVFPKDYPMMPAGLLWHENEAVRRRAEWTRRPPQYRLVQRDAHPFGGGQMWKELSSGEDAAAGRGSGGGLVRLRLAVRGRGRPVPNAAVLSGETGALIGFVLAGGYSRRLGRGWGDALARACDVLENVGGVGAHGGGIVVKIVGPEGVENGEFFAWARPV